MSSITLPLPAMGRDRFGAKASRTEATALVSLRGELDLAATPSAEAALGRLIDAGVHDLLVDLERLTYLDCAGLGALLRAARDAETVGARVYVFRAQGQPRQLVEFARKRCAVAGF
jgi:stage II sporulation protein AA (anti-sigma F factor antagonist)